MRPRSSLPIAVLIATLASSCGERESIGANELGTTIRPAATVDSGDVSLGTVAPDVAATTVGPQGTLAPDTVDAQPQPDVVSAVVPDDVVRALATEFELDGEIEHLEGEFGRAQCIGRLENRGICVNSPLWGAWTYWDLDAQSLPGTGDDEAVRAADALFERLGVQPGRLESVQPNGPLAMVTFSDGAEVMVAESERIASVHAPAALLLGRGARDGSTGKTSPPTSTPQTESVGGPERCVDAETRYAPIGVPDGWQRFVLDAQPSGACGADLFLFMSLVVPGTDDAPRTLVTFTSQPAGTSAPQPGEAITISDNPATLQRSVQADGTPATSITMRVGGVSISGHGNVGADTLIDLMSTVGPLTADEWDELVAETG